MSSHFSGDYFTGRSQRPYTGQLPELLPDPTSQILHRLPSISGKRSLAEFQAQNQQNQALSFYLRNVKSRSSNSILGYPVSRNTEINPGFLNYSNLVHNQNEKMELPNLRQNSVNTHSLLGFPNLVPNQNEKMMNKPQELGQNTQTTPGFLNYPNLVPIRNENLMNKLQELGKNTQNNPQFFNHTNLVPNQREITQMMMNKLHQHVESPVLRQNTEITPHFFSNLNSVHNHMNKLQQPESLVSRQNTETTLDFLNYTNSVPNHDKMSKKLQELEKHLLDDDEGDDTDTNSVVTNTDWSDTWRHLIGPRQPHPTPHPTSHPLASLSPTSSCSSCCSTSSPLSLSLNQTITEAASAINENKPEVAKEILTRLAQSACVNGTPEQRLAKYFSDALLLRVGPTRALDTYVEDNHVLYEVSPCFKLGFMAANLAIIDATSSDSATSAKKVHVIDFEIGRGGHYVHLIHAVAAKKKDFSLKITAVTEFRNSHAIVRVGDGLRSLATKAGVSLTFNVLSLKVTDLSVEKLGIEKGEKLAVNLPFRLYKLPDESVTMDNPRDELLRRVKGLSPMVVTLVEQEMNMNTAPFLARVNESCAYYSALFDSLDSTMARDNSDRVKIEEELGCKLSNAVARDGRERVERCEVFGKWRARLGMAGFRPMPISRPIVESLMGLVGSGPRGNPGFTVKDENGGILFGWMGRTLTVASAWM